jgi:hypothetical protein
MPRPEEKPPNKRVEEIVSEITNEMMEEMPQIEDDEISKFFIRQIAECRAVNEVIQKELNEILKK